MNVAISKVKYIKITPTKLRLVADIVRGKRFDKALSLLFSCKKRGKKFVFQGMRSALDCLERDMGKKVDFDAVFVRSVSVDEGSKLKRFIPRAMGRSSSIIRRYSHLNIELEVKS